jgi:hypothetical protein
LAEEARILAHSLSSIPLKTQEEILERENISCKTMLHLIFEAKLVFCGSTSCL